MKKIAGLFPGQGAQYSGMGKDFASAFAIARETFQEADELLSRPLSKLVFEGSDDELTETRNSQLAIFVMSMAVLRTLQQQFPSLHFSAFAGLSLGEYTALCASGRLSFAETLCLIEQRARFMNEACEKVPGTMAAVLGLDALAIEAALRGRDGVWVANYNCPGQTVISGTAVGVAAATPLLKEAGARRVIPLSVHGAFHSGLMQRAQEQLAPAIERAPLQESSVGLVMNVPGDFVTTLSAVRSHLISQVTHSVRWEQGVRAMEKSGVEIYLEIGCGKALTGFNQKIGVRGQTCSIDKVADLDGVAQVLEAPCSC